MTPQLQTAKRLLYGRRLRDEVFGAECDGFGEPAWDMLLLLFVDEGEGRATSADDAIDEAGGQGNNATLYLDWLVSRGLVLRDVRDGRSIVTLQDRGRSLMISYLDGEIKGATCVG